MKGKIGHVALLVRDYDEAINRGVELSRDTHRSPRCAPTAIALPRLRSPADKRLRPSS
jgi:hypothetical protein